MLHTTPPPVIQPTENVILVTIIRADTHGNGADYFRSESRMFDAHISALNYAEEVLQREATKLYDGFLDTPEGPSRHYPRPAVRIYALRMETSRDGNPINNPRVIARDISPSDYCDTENWARLKAAWDDTVERRRIYAQKHNLSVRPA